MITIIAGNPGSGKTALLAYFLGEKLNTTAYQDYLNHKRECKMLEAGGFPAFDLPSQKFLIFADFDFHFTKKIRAYEIDGFSIGLPNPFFKTVKINSYSTVALDEAQKYYDSRLSKYLREEVYRYYQIHRQDHLNFFMTCQRLGNIDLNIRGIADKFIIVDRINVQTDDVGLVSKITWDIVEFDSCEAAEHYQLNSDNKSTHVGKTRNITTTENVFAWYDSYSCKPAFYRNLHNTSIEYKLFEGYDNSLESFVNYNNNHSFMAPQGYYKDPSYDKMILKYKGA